MLHTLQSVKIFSTETPKYASLSEKAYEEIRKKIVTIALEPGSVIDEAQLRTELEVGRTPIREALQRLALDQLVTIVPRRGMFVTDIAFSDLQRLFEVRIELEALAGQLASERRTPEHLQMMQSLFDQLSHLPSETNNTVLIQFDRLFHEVIYQAADNHFLQMTLQSRYALSLRLWYYSLEAMNTMRSNIDEHFQIYQALENQHSGLASKLLRDHILSFQRSVQNVMLNRAGQQPTSSLP